MATAETPDLVILDIMMPRMDGVSDPAEAQGGRNYHREIPVLFLSAKAQTSDIEKGHQQGVAGYLTKPFDPSELLEVIEQLVHAEP